MTVANDVLVLPVTRADLARVAQFLHQWMNSRLSAAEWAEAMVPTWRDESPNHGFMLVEAGEVIGVNLAYYSVRVIQGRPEAFCNLAALCVREEARPHTVRLLRSLLKQPGYHFTDLSPSGNVVELDRRLGFRPLDTETTLVLNFPRPRGGVRLITQLDEIGRLLQGRDAEIFADHRSARAARHLLITRGGDHSYVIFRKDRRKRLPIFATILYASNPDLFTEAFGHVAAHLLVRHGAVATLAERRVVEFHPSLGRALRHSRPKTFKSTYLVDHNIDYLYSELTCVPW